MLEYNNCIGIFNNQNLMLICMYPILFIVSVHIRPTCQDYIGFIFLITNELDVDGKNN